MWSPPTESGSDWRIPPVSLLASGMTWRTPHVNPEVTGGVRLSLPDSLGALRLSLPDSPGALRMSLPDSPGALCLSAPGFTWRSSPTESNPNFPRTV